MLDHFVDTAASLSHTVVAGFPGTVRRHLYSLKVLIGALERVRTGGTYVPLTLTEAAPTAERAPWRLLTRRQRDVLALIAEGKANKLIADALNMSESTVKAHVKQIIRRLNVANRTQAALLATRARTGH